jgi:hypothetical protein
MSDKVQICVIIAASVLIAIWMIKATVHRLATMKDESFTFRFNLLLGKVELYRGEHKPPAETRKTSPE